MSAILLWFYYLADGPGHTSSILFAKKTYLVFWKSHYMLVLCIWLLKYIVFCCLFPPVNFVSSTNSFLFLSIDNTPPRFFSTAINFFFHILKFGTDKCTENLEALYKKNFFVSEPFDGKLPACCLNTPRYFNVRFLQTRTFSYTMI